VVPVDIDPYTAQGSSEAGFPALGVGDLFNGAVPVAQCAVRGFTSHLNLYATISVSTAAFTLVGDGSRLNFEVPQFVTQNKKRWEFKLRDVYYFVQGLMELLIQSNPMKFV
jgi:hypothetical protein